MGDQSARLRARWRARVAPLSPGHRRFKRFLRALPLDPDALPDPLEPLGDRDFIACGCPRTGTSLLAAALFQPPHVVTVMEPWDGMRMPPAELLASIRDELAAAGTLSRGRLDLDALDERGAAVWCRDGASARAIATNERTSVGVKWTGYWRFLDRLQGGRWIVCLRHPAEVIASFREAGGRVSLGLQYDTPFNARLNDEMLRATHDVELRRVLLFDHIHERLLPHLDRPDVFVVRYERWHRDPAALVAELSGFLDAPLELEVRIAPHREPVLSERERELLHSRCRTAAALGYEL